MGMTWRQGPQDFYRLNALSNITARLLRISVFEKIRRGEAQLAVNGVPTGLAEIYKEHALAQRYTLIPQKVKDLEEEFVRVKSGERSTF